jgi:hypothetical protein
MLPARLVVIFCVAISSTNAGTVTNFDDIKFWVGTGANEAALALDWNGPSATDNALVWGYRWDGAAKGIDMLTAIVTADDRLYAKMGPISGFGFAVVGLGYDANNDGQFTLDDDTSFDEHGISNAVPSDGAASIDPADWYAEGWFVSQFWNYGVAASSPFDGDAWARSGSGISSRNLMNGSWHSLAITPINTQSFAQNPLAAEPSGHADFNGDGHVDGRDLLAWQRGESFDPLSIDDLVAWQANYAVDSLSALPLPPSTFNFVIPEPSTGLLLLLFVFLLPRITQPDWRIVS